MDNAVQLEELVVSQLQRRGLLPAPGAPGFYYHGQFVKVTLEKSVYTGWFVTVYDRGHKVQQFRARAGGYDWNAIAALVKEIADKRRAFSHAPLTTVHSDARPKTEGLARDLARLTSAAAQGALKIRPSASPGRVRVEMSEMDLDPVSVLRLFAVVRDALPKGDGSAQPEPQPLL
jgi:hypothetical protein